MADYTLYYWPVPFRGEFVRAILAHQGASVDEPDSDAIAAMMAADPQDQPIPHMAPPMLVQTATGKAVAQMPAICLWLGRTLDLLPSDPHEAACAIKLAGDANDVLDEMTLDGGKSMWTAQTWADYQPRLRRWMGIWEASPLADPLSQILAATLWGTMTERLPALRPLLEAEAPGVAALADRLRAEPALAAQAKDSRKRFGDAWCGGEIEKSLRHVLSIGQ
ncbi:glutathione S-transferase [Cereibacter sp. SYSU M97828]|nr:glutathione S-transferase [Cereibacter flavus]